MKAKGAVIGFAAVDLILIVICIYLYLNQDRIAPVITFEEDGMVYSREMDEESLLQGVSAYDETDGDVTAFVVIEKISETADGEVIVTYAAVDSSNNVVKRARIYKVE